MLNSNEKAEAINTKTSEDENKVDTAEEKKSKKKQDEQALVKENKNLKNNRELDHYYIEFKLLRETKSALEKEQAKSHEESQKRSNVKKQGSKKKRRKPVFKYYTKENCKYGEKCRYHHPDAETTDDDQLNAAESQKCKRQEEQPWSPPRTSPPPPVYQRNSPQRPSPAHG